MQLYVVSDFLMLIELYIKEKSSKLCLLILVYYV